MKTPDQDTKYIARLHKKASPRGLNIYNPFFEEAGINAIYMLHYNEDPKPLIEGMRNLSYLGGIAAGYENDKEFAALLDELDPISTMLGKVGFVKNIDGKLVGSYQGGIGLLNSIREKYDLTNKDIAIVGAGTVATAMLHQIKQDGIKPKSVTVLNRSVENAEKLGEMNDLVRAVKSIDEISNVQGDILINITDIGGSEPDNLYTEQIVEKFEMVSDVTFEREDTNLLNLAQKLGKSRSTGWDMFSHQAIVILESLFEEKMDVELFRKFVRKGLSEVVA